MKVQAPSTFLRAQSLESASFRRSRMAFIIEEGVWKQFPDMLLVVAYAEGIDNEGGNADLEKAIRDLHVGTRAGWKYENAQSHPHVAAWRAAFRDAMNLSSQKYPSSIEALARRVLSGKAVATINPVVDFYNMVSVRYVVPVGGWDVDELVGGDVVLRHTTGDDTFSELGTTGMVRVEPGEVTYADAKELITRHFVWRQSEEAKVTSRTRRLFLVSEILPEVGGDVAESVRNAVADGLREYFDVEADTRVLQRGTERWDWDRAG